MKPVRQKRTAAALALLCLAALFCGDLTRGIHLLTARHVFCAAHGELVEAESAGERSGFDGGGVMGVLPEDDADHHEHCSLAAAPARQFGTGVPDAALAGVTRSDESTLELPRADDDLGRCVIAYAPKQGPPLSDGSRRS